MQEIKNFVEKRCRVRDVPSLQGCKASNQNDVGPSGIRNMIKAVRRL
jgi:hypothetical protein